MIGAVVQARMSSARLPGKVLSPIAGKPVLDYVLERLDRSDALDTVAVATSVEASDDAVAKHCERLGVPVHRGPLENVAARFAEAAERFGLDAFVRVTADSPLLDQRLVDRGVALFQAGVRAGGRAKGHDIVTNVFPSTFPSGQSVEVVSSEAMRTALGEMNEPDELEHVTLHFYRHPERYEIENFTSQTDEGGDDGELDMSLDTEEDAALIEAMIARMDKPHWEYTSAQLVELYRDVRRDTGAPSR